MPPRDGTALLRCCAPRGGGGLGRWWDRGNGDAPCCDAGADADASSSPTWKAATQTVISGRAAHDAARHLKARSQGEAQRPGPPIPCLAKNPHSSLVPRAPLQTPGALACCPDTPALRHTAQTRVCDSRHAGRSILAVCWTGGRVRQTPAMLKFAKH